MADSSFDIVSKFDKQEIANAVNSASKEIATRYDFKNVGASVDLAGDVIKMKANTEERCLAVLDVVQTHLVKRKVSLKHLDVPEAGPRISGKEYHLDAPSRRASPRRTRRRSTSLIRDEGPKGVKSQIQGDEPAGVEQVPRRPPGRPAHAARGRPRRRTELHQPALSARVRLRHRRTHHVRPRMPSTPVGGIRAF